MRREKLLLKDNYFSKDIVQQQNDMGIRYTNVEMYIPGTDILVWKGHNKSVFTGAPYTMYKHFDITNPAPGTDVRKLVPCYDNFPLVKTTSNGAAAETFKLEISDEDKANANLDESKIYLWCVGKNGCTSNPSQIVASPYAGWIWPEDLIPFRVVETSFLTSDTTELNVAQVELQKYLKANYFGERIMKDPDEVSESKYSALYFKKINTAEMKIKRVGKGNPYLTDGDNIGRMKKTLEDLYYESYVNYNSLDLPAWNKEVYSTYELEACVELSLHLTKHECREWFILEDESIKAARGNLELNESSVSSISLCTATPIKDEDGKVVDYCYITPVTRLNFYTKLLGDLEMGLDIIYQLYY